MSDRTSGSQTKPEASTPAQKTLPPPTTEIPKTDKNLNVPMPNLREDDAQSSRSKNPEKGPSPGFHEDYEQVKRMVLKKTARELIKHYKLSKKDAENVAINLENINRANN